MQQKPKRKTAAERIKHSIKKFGDKDHSKERKLKIVPKVKLIPFDSKVPAEKCKRCCFSGIKGICSCPDELNCYKGYFVYMEV